MSEHEKTARDLWEGIERGWASKDDIAAALTAAVEKALDAERGQLVAKLRAKAKAIVVGPRYALGVNRYDMGLADDEIAADSVATKPVDWVSIGIDTNVAINQAFADAALYGVGFVMITPAKSECILPERVSVRSVAAPDPVAAERAACAAIVQKTLDQYAPETEGHAALCDVLDLIEARGKGDA